MTENAPPITLTGAQLCALVDLSGLHPGDHSPLAGLHFVEPAAELAAGDWQKLRDLGWVEGDKPPRIAPAATATLEALCRPNVIASALLGTRDTAMTTAMYGARGSDEDALVSFLADPDEDAYVIESGQSPSTLVDAVAAQVFAGPLDQAVLFDAALAPAAFVGLLGILEWRLHAQLQAMLDREPASAPVLTAQAIWEVLAEGRMANDLAWPVTVFTYLFPFLDFELDEGSIQTVLAALEEEDLVSRSEDGRYTVSSSLLKLADALLPLVSYAALHVDVQGKTGTVSSTWMAFLRGGAAWLVAQPVLNEDGEQVIAVDSVEAERLAEILFELGLPGRLTGVQSPEQRICPACGAEARPGLAFCTQCGAQLSTGRDKEPQVESAQVTTTAGSSESGAPAAAPAPRYCSSCGAEARAEWSFCNLCGAPLRASRDKGAT